jgi:CBS domain-containing protein
MLVNEICTLQATHVGRDTRVVEAARVMREAHVGALVVVETRGNRLVPVGVLTDRDIVVGILAQDIEHLDVLDVGDVVADVVVTASEDEDVTPVLRRMREFGVRRAPVVDARGALIGILTADDVISALSDEIAEVASLVSQQSRREGDHRP